MKIRFLSPASIELADAIGYYEDQRPGLGYELLSEVEAAIDIILQFPDAWTLLSKRTRRILLQWFTTTDGLVPRQYSKSTIERFEKAFERDEIEQLIHEVNRAVSERETAQELILQEELDLTHLWADTTCITANIH